MRYAETGSIPFTGSTTCKVLRFSLWQRSIRGLVFPSRVYQHIVTTRRVCAVLAFYLDIFRLLACEAIYEIVEFGYCHCHCCHSDRQFCCMQQDLYTPPFVKPDLNSTKTHRHEANNGKASNFWKSISTEQYSVSRLIAEHQSKRHRLRRRVGIINWISAWTNQGAILAPEAFPATQKQSSIVFFNICTRNQRR